MVYDESDTDMLVAMPLPLTDLFRDGLSPWEDVRRAGRARPRPHGLLGLGQPAGGPPGARPDGAPGREFGAKAFKFYNVRYDYGAPFPWRMDDPQVAFPVFEKAQELGVNLIGVHKGVPLGPQPIEHTQTWDMDGAAANFPDINFVIFHVGLPFLDETCWQLIRYPNLYASLAATDQLRRPGAPACSPRSSASCCSGAARTRSSTAREAPIWQPQWALQAFMDFEIPQDLCDGYGYPQLTDQAKRKILGENLLRLHGMDVEETKARLGRPQSH